MKAQIHRFRDKVALYVGNGDTVYLSRNDAERIAKALDDCATDVGNISDFSRSEFQTLEIEIGDSKR